MNIVSAIIDIVILSIIAFSLIIGFKRGLARVILEVVAWLLALIFAVFLSSPLASVFYNAAQPKLIGQIDKKADVLIDDNLEESVTQIYESLPKITSNTATFFGATPIKTADDVYKKYSDKEKITVGKVINLSIKPFVLMILRGIIFAILFVIFLPLLKWGAVVLDKLFKAPVISTTNKLLGALLGLAEALIITIIIASVVNLFISFTLDKNDFVNTKAVEETYVFKYAYNNNPLVDVFNTVNQKD
jgi:uncharacterized membrane protein required for colicin V production